MEKCLVTGGAGFIGSHIVEELVKRRYKVRVLDNFSTGNRNNLSQVLKEIEVIEGDLRDLATVQRAMTGVSYVFHVGAVRAVARSVDDPIETTETNVNGTLHVLLAARDRGARRVVYSSSSSVYGDAEKFPLCEEDQPNPLSPYAASKLMGEYYGRIFSQLYGLETVCLRYFNVFGPRQNPESKYSTVIPIFMASLLNNEPPEIHWDGKQARDFTYVDNVVHANMLAIRMKEAQGEVFNIACQEEHSILDIFKLLGQILGKDSIKPLFRPKRPGDVRRTLADISKAKERLGFSVQTRFRPGLERTVQWFAGSSLMHSVER